MEQGAAKWVVAGLFWASMISLFVGIYRVPEPGWPYWFVGFGVLLTAAYGVRYWAVKRSGRG
ncbi:hypothetical protein ABGB12_06815 [Actinocorallia sp. B10E7]|uniref:hypothetical protein n=1 Tax=Actinocorallia sp. B10E7 TaxID=3153558 RepID=UPI00325EF82E